MSASVLEGARKLLTCVLPKGSGPALLHRVSAELGLDTAQLHSARGLTGSDPLGIFNRVEKEVLTVIVPAARAEEVFLWLYREGEVSTRPGRFLYQAPILGATPFDLPEGVPREAQA